MGEDEDSEAEAHDVSGSAEEDSGGAKSTVGEGEARGVTQRLWAGDAAALASTDLLNFEHSDAVLRKQLFKLRPVDQFKSYAFRKFPRLRSEVGCCNEYPLHCLIGHYCPVEVSHR